MKAPTVQFLSPLMYSNSDILSMEVIRKDIMSILQQTALEYVPGTVPQCIYLNGEAGSGKTFLLLQLKSHLGTETNIIYHDFRFDSPQTLRNFYTKIESGEIAPRSIILADNFDCIVDETTGNDHFYLRKLFSEVDAPLLIASGRSVPNALIRYDGAFYDSFKLIYLEKLSREQSVDLAKSVSNLAEKYSGELSKVFDEIGGTPRQVLLITNELAHNRHKYDDIVAGVIDRMTPHYENILEKLAPTARDIFLTLLLHGPGTLPMIREYTQLPSSITSAYLHTLMNKGLVIKKVSGARKGIYCVQDSLMSKWAEKILCGNQKTWNELSKG